MTFSKKIKEELSKLHNLADRACVRAELIGYLLSNNISLLKTHVKYATENEYNINRLHKLLLNLKIDYTIQMQGKHYTITFKRPDIQGIEYKQETIQLVKSEGILSEENPMEKKAMIRGCFLGGGSFNNPNQKYHLEMVCSSKKNATDMKDIIQTFGIQVKILERRKGTALYIKEAEEISKLLACIGATKSMLDFEEIRVMRDTKNNVNRLVNCETANLNKTIQASVEQIKQIRYLKTKRKFETLPENLKEIANLRMKHPEASLVELGQMLVKPIGKSGVNHRLQKICEIAEEERDDNGKRK